MGNPFNEEVFFSWNGDLTIGDLSVSELVDMVRAKQSLFIEGPPGSGKTLFLRQLERELRTSQGCLTAWVNIGELLADPTFQDERFWADALAVVKVAAQQGVLPPDIKALYDRMAGDQYSISTRENLLSQLRNAGLRVVVFLDDVDQAIDAHVAHARDVLLPLRSLASTPSMGICEVAASVVSASVLQRRADPTQTAGSPIFNHTQIMTLTGLTPEQSLRALEHADPVFGRENHEFVWNACSGNPCFTRLVGAALWAALQTNADRATAYAEVRHMVVMQASDTILATFRALEAQREVVIEVAGLKPMDRTETKRRPLPEVLRWWVQAQLESLALSDSNGSGILDRFAQSEREQILKEVRRGLFRHA